MMQELLVNISEFVYATIRKNVNDLEELPPIESLELDTSLTEELGLDSLDMLEIVYAIEEEYNVKVPDEHISRINTFGDVVKSVQELVLSK